MLRIGGPGESEFIYYDIDFIDFIELWNTVWNTAILKPMLPKGCLRLLGAVVLYLDVTRFICQWMRAPTPPFSIALGHKFVCLVPICGAIE
jgi:hypothetical protein